MKRTLVPIVKRERLTPDIFSLTIEAPRIARKARPGQFLNLRVGDGADPLLRRPISICDVHGDRVRLVIREVGRGTKLLARLRREETLDVLGPLGKPAPMFRARKVFLCGGGVGIAPLLFAARRLAPQNAVRAFLGARTRRQLILQRDFIGLGVMPEVATDDGSSGHLGVITQLVGPAVATSYRPVVFACGPRPMLAALVRLVDPVPVYGFVEDRMGCGTGVCYCCALPRKTGGYVRFCEEGPVVLLNEVEL